MAEVKRSDSFLLFLSNENKNLIPELYSNDNPSNFTTFIRTYLHIFFLSVSFPFSIFPVLFLLLYLSPPKKQLEMESYRSLRQSSLPVQIFYLSNKRNRNYASQKH